MIIYINMFKYMNSDSHHWRMPLVGFTLGTVNAKIRFMEEKENIANSLTFKYPLDFMR